MITPFPIPSAKITELIFTRTSHVIAPLVFLYHEKAVRTPFELKISFQYSNHSIITLCIFFVGRVQANLTEFLNTFGAKQILFPLHHVQLGFFTIRTHFVGRVAQHFQIFNDPIISLFQVIWQFLIRLALFVQRLFAVLLGALNHGELVPNFVEGVVFEAVLAELVIAKTQFGELLIFEFLVANSTLFVVDLHHDVVFMPAETDR